MAVTPTANKFLNQVTVGTEVGTWGPYINANAAITDASFGATTNIALTNTNVLLSSTQYACQFISLAGALSGNVLLQFPFVGSFYTIMNFCTNSSAFVVTAGTTVAGGRVIGLPMGANLMTFMTDASGHARYIGMPPSGTLWEYGGSSVPNWVSACSVVPYLNCDGSTFSAATNPNLAAILGSTTLPDLRGRYRANLNQGTGRITTATGGVDGDTNSAAGGVQSITLAQAQLPNYNLTVTDPGHVHTQCGTAGNGTYSAFGSGNPQGPASNTGNSVTGITVNSAGSGTAVQNLPPTAVSGITMIKT